MQSCTACALPLDGQVRFCMHCGTPVAGNAPPAPLAPEPMPETASGVRMLADAASLQSDRRVVTVLFADVSGFTAMSEKLDPEEVTDIINSCFRVLSEPIARYGGVVDKYIGDAVMALFGAPVAHEDDPERAALAACEMQLAARQFSDDLERRTGIRLALRIGLNTGLVIAGSVGGTHKREYTVMGDAVNLAQRMEANAQPGTVLAAPDTYKAIRHRFDCQALPAIQVKGKAEPVPVFQILGLANRDAAPQPADVAQRPWFVGREVELARLRQLLDLALLGSPQLVALVGEAGIGKTALVRRFMEDLSPRGIRVLRGQCLSYRADTPYGLVAELLVHLLGRQESDEERLAALRALCKLHFHEDGERAAGLLAILLGIEPQQADLNQLSPEQRRRAAFETFDRVLFALAAAHPLLITLADMHWADQASMEWLVEFLNELQQRREDARPIMLLVQHRPQGPETDRTGPLRLAMADVLKAARVDVTQVMVGPLKGADCHRMVASLLETDPATWSPDLGRYLEQLLARAEGNPLFLREMILGQIENGGLIQDAQGRWTPSATARLSQLPANISGVVASRIDQLPSELKRLAQIAAVIGRNVGVRLLSIISEVSDAEPALKELAVRGFMHRRDNGEYAFNHTVTQATLYQSLLLASRKELHRKAAEALVEALGAEAHDHPQILARHFLLAEEKAPAIKYLVLSGHVARRSFANGEAISCYRQVLKLLDEDRLVERNQMLWALGQVQTTVGSYAEARSCYEELLARGGLGAVQQAEALQGMGVVLEREGRYPEALASYERALALVSEGPALPIRIQLLVDIAFVRYRMGEMVACVGTCEEALAVGARVSAPLAIANAHNMLGTCFLRQGSGPEALRHYKEALSIRESQGDLPGMANTLNNLGITAKELMGDWAMALDYYRRALALYQKIGDLARIAMIENNLGELYGTQGDLDEARRVLAESLTHYRQIGDRYGIAATLVTLGEVLARHGWLEEALPHLEEALPLMEVIRSGEMLSLVHHALGGVYLELARLDEAREHLDRAIALAEQAMAAVQLGIARRLAGQLAVQEGRFDQGLTLLRGAVAELAERGALLELGDARLALAQALTQVLSQSRAYAPASGQTELRSERDSQLAEAIAVFRKLGVKPALRRAEALVCDLPVGSSR